MAFDKTRLTSSPSSPFMRVAYYDHPTDDAATIEAANYFLPAVDALPKGTIIVCVSQSSGTPVLRQLVVTASSSASVTVAKQSVA